MVEGVYVIKCDTCGETFKTEALAEKHESNNPSHWTWVVFERTDQSPKRAVTKPNRK